MDKKGDILDDNLTPGMRQYMSVKQKHPDCIVLFRMGDFYETFYQDAKTASRELDITLTSRGKGEKKAPLAGIPYHSLQPYLAKLISKGYKVCIVEQMEDPKKAKGLVKRDVLRIITPGTVMDETILNEKSNNYIMAINKDHDNVAIAVADISTGEFSVLETSYQKFENELIKYSPAEILLPMSLENSQFAISLKSYFVNYLDDLHFFHEKAHTLLKSTFQNIPNMNNFLLTSAGALLYYLSSTQKSDLKHMTRIKIVNTDDYMLLDKVTISNLNILSNPRDEKASLLSVIDRTCTSMGSRLIRKWLTRPILNIKEILDRYDAVGEIKNNMILKEELTEILSSVQDLERLITRISFRTASPKDLVALRLTLSKIPALNTILSSLNSPMLNRRLDEFPELITLLNNAVLDEPNTLVRDGNIIRDSYSVELDELRKIKSSSKEWLLEFEAEEKRKTGIKFLKVSYNNIFGYFIEVSKSNLSMVPDYYIRKQTQLNSERFITPELKEKENIILSADDRIKEIEFTLFMQLLDTCTVHISKIQNLADSIARIDVLLSFADVSLKNRYSRPTISNSMDLEIVKGRHPIVESLENGFVSNDIKMDNDFRMMIITGPNMAGKSVYIKQNAIIILLAQIGCFVPAEKAHIGIVDRIFSRVGASDDIASGHSTFMVEMSETANILANASETSFIILDEIGRGTSTYDGVSLAWAIAEFIATKIKARTLFATHYHNLNKMADEFKSIRNYNIAVSEKDDGIIFLRKIIPGATDKSYGIQVAKLAGLPKEVIETSKRIINQLGMEDEIGAMLHRKLKSGDTSKIEIPIADLKRESKEKHDSESREFQKTLL